MDNLSIFKNRHSVRQFKDVEVPMDDIRKMIHAATLAPSGKNAQNWHFVVIRNKEKIAEIVRIVERKNAQLADMAKKEETKKSIKASLMYQTVFRNGPVLILVYAGPYPTIGTELKAEGALSDEEAEILLRPAAGIQNVSAAMENLLLAAADMGYGGCWMVGPIYASEEITEYIGFNKPGYYLAALTPIGVPASDKLSSPKRKPVDEVLTVIE